MKLYSAVLALLAAPFLAAAQSNPFNIPASGLSATAGQSLTLTWQPTTSGTVSLVLRSGNSADLDQGSVIASGLANSGSYTWNVPSSTVRGTSYTVEIVDDSDPSQANYTPPFTIDSTVVGTPSLGTLTSTPGVTSSSGTASSTGSTATEETSSTAATTSSSAETSSGATTSSGSTATTRSGSSTASSSTNTIASTVGIQSTSSSGVAARATAMAGMLGAVALGALAL